MSNLEEITYEDINDKIQLVLCANMGTMYNHYELYNAVTDKFSRTSNSIHPNFKYKFMHVIKQLLSNNSDITIFKDRDNDVYYIGYDIKQEVTEPCIIDTQWFDKDGYIKFIIDNNLEDEFMYQDPKTGNNLYHDLFNTGDYSTIKKVIDTHDIDYTIKNKINNTPIDCINRIEVATLVISDLNKKIHSLEKRLTKLETKDYLEEYSIYNFLKLKFIRFVKQNYLYIGLYIFIVVSYKLFVKQNYLDIGLAIFLAVIYKLFFL